MPTTSALIKWIVFLGLVASLSAREVHETVTGYAVLHPKTKTTPDYARARKLFQAGAAKGDPTAQAMYAAMCMAGLGGPVDMNAACVNLDAADEQKSPRAALLLADLYARGDDAVGIHRDYDRALAYAHRSEGISKAAAAPLVARIERMKQGLPPEDVVHPMPKLTVSLDHLPAVVEQVDPVYPLALQVLGLGATVWVELVVQPDGTPTNVHVVAPTLPDFDAAAIVAVAKFKFSPGAKEGEPVAMPMRIPIIFSTD